MSAMDDRFAVPDRAPPPLGAHLRGRYRLLEIVGRGGTSTVFRAEDAVRLRARSPRPQVAVKVVDLVGEYQSDAVELLHREARRMQSLAHPNIVKVFDSDTDGRYHFIIMELLSGATLSQILRGPATGGLPLDQAMGLVRRIGSALAFAHARDVVHADLKPSNVFITRSRSVKLLDFGLAHAIRPAAQTEADEDATILYIERLGGLTPQFASIEMLTGGAPTKACDIYAFGVLTYLMLCGRHPYNRKTAIEAERLGLEPVRPPQLDKARWRTLRAALEVDSTRRIQSIEAFVETFNEPSWFRRLIRRSGVAAL